MHVGEVFKNNVKENVGYSHMAMISQMPGPNPVGLCKLTHKLDSAWFQPSSLKRDNILGFSHSLLSFKFKLCAATPRCGSGW